MFLRTEIIEQNFRSWVSSGDLPEPRHAGPRSTLAEAGLTAAGLIELFESQVLSRHLDLVARELKNHGQCYYTIGSSGHEGNAVAGRVFRLTDMAFLHYRSGAFFIQRSRQRPGSTPIHDLLLSLTAAKAEPIAGGRHKVFGSLPLLVPPQTSTIASHLPKAVGAAFSVGRADDLGLPGVMPSDAVVLCSFGDASVNHATAQSAFNTADLVSFQKMKMPIVFLCEDNGIGISVPTAPGWIESQMRCRSKIRYFHADGLNLIESYVATAQAARVARELRVPVFLHLSMVRLLGHAGSDVESTYRSLEQIEATERQDPLLHSARLVLEQTDLSAEDVVRLYEDLGQQVRAVARHAVTLPALTNPEEVRATIVSCREPRPVPSPPSERARQEAFGRDYEKLHQPQHLAKLLNWGLTDILLRYRNAVVFGEDVAAKGGVYNVTDDLLRRFGPKRVFNSPLDETTILGTALGLAHNGFLPIPEIQFLAYIHNAEDQLRGEASTLAFFSQGQFTNPLFLRVAGLGYQKGFGGHFHNDNSLAVFRDLPGVVLAVPSNGADAVKMQRTCAREAHANGRVVVFVEPIALYMTKDLYAPQDKKWSFPYPPPEEEIPLGEFGLWEREGQVTSRKRASGLDRPSEILVFTYGNGTYHSLQAMRRVEEQVQVDWRLIDLRWLAPLDWEGLTRMASRAQRLLVVEECRKTGSFSEQLVAGLVERLRNLPPLKVVAADDCFIPLGPAAAAGLPSVTSITSAALELLADRAELGSAAEGSLA